VPTGDDEKLGLARTVATIVFILLAFVCLGEVGRYMLARHHHVVRIVGVLFLAALFAIGAWFSLRYQSLAAEEAREAEEIAAARATAEAAAEPGQRPAAATQA
jgi:hypothetical protein